MTKLSTFDDARPLSAPLFCRPVNARQAGLRVAVLLSNGFSMLSLSSITDTLSFTARENNVVTTSLFGLTSTKIQSRSGIHVTADHFVPDTQDGAAFIRRFDIFFFCTGDSNAFCNKIGPVRTARTNSNTSEIDPNRRHGFFALPNRSRRPCRWSSFPSNLV